MNTENQLENFEKLPSLFYTKLPRIIRKKEFQKAQQEEIYGESLKVASIEP